MLNQIFKNFTALKQNTCLTPHKNRDGNHVRIRNNVKNYDRLYNKKALL